MGKLKIINEFKEFALKGNVIDMAVGVIIGGAFSKIVTSLVNDIIMPIFGLILGRVSFANLAITVASNDSSNTPIEIKYGMFMQNILDFLIVAICIFFAIKMINMFKKKQPAKEETPKETPPSKEELLLTEIRDILRTGK